VHGALGLAQLGAVEAALAGCDAVQALVLGSCEARVLAAS
jgi:hypothetical protein